MIVDEIVKVEKLSRNFSFAEGFFEQPHLS